MKILFSCVGRRVELIQCFKNAANELSEELIVCGTDISETAPALSFCDKKFIVPRISDESYIPTLLSICKDEEIDILIPTIDTDLLILAKNKKEFLSVGTRILVSEPDKVAICRDKRLTGTFFNECGLSAPSTSDNVANYTGGFPAFIKPKDGSSSINAYKVLNSNDLQMYANQVPDYIIQPFVEGTEYTVDIFCDFEGNPIYITPRIRLAVRAGEVLKSEIRIDKSIVNEMLAFVKKYKPCGAITVQLIKEVNTGRNMYIEINPRFGGGSPLSIKSGADSAKALIRLFRGETLAFFENSAEDGAVFCRFDQSVRVK